MILVLTLILPQVMTKWVCQAILDSLVIYFMPLTAYQNPVTVWAHRGYGDGLYVFGTTVYACLLMAMMLKVFNLTSVSCVFCLVWKVKSRDDTIFSVRYTIK